LPRDTLIATGIAMRNTSARPRSENRAGRAYIGTSGWSYPEWREEFYAGAPAREWLGIASARFTALEINASFYHELKRATFEHWRDATAPDFRFAVKAHRYVTHVKRLDAPAESFRRQRREAEALGEKLAAMLWQLPGTLKRDLGRLERFAARLKRWDTTRHAIEFRDASWFDAEVAALMRSAGLAVVQSDAADWPMWDAVTTDVVYVRLHGHSDTYASSYGPVALRRWSSKCRKWMGEGRDVHVYFDNTAGGNAPANALALLGMVGLGARRRSSHEPKSV
jgi:MYXO-CTERM domain-containing protein